MQVPDNFLGLEEEFCDYKKGKVAILPVGFDGTRKWLVGERWQKNTALGPKAIITASRNMEWYDNEYGGDICKMGICTLEELKGEEVKEIINKIKEKGKKLIEEGKFVVMLGGEHSITTGMVRVYKEKFPGLSVLQIDAHSDLREAFEGNPYSHASVMARVREECEKVVQVGIRGMDKEEVEKIKEKGWGESIFYAKNIVGKKGWVDKVVSGLGEEIYVTIDLDGLDPSIMGAVGTPEPGGLGWYEVLELLREVAEKKKVVGFDVVELAPDGRVECDFLAAKLVYKFLGYVFKKR